MESEEQKSRTDVLRTIKIKTMENSVFELSVSPDSLISELKKAIAEKSGIPIERQRLICKAKLLVDEMKVSDYVDEDGQFIHLLKTQSPVDGQPQRRTDQDFNNTTDRRLPPQGMGVPFNPLQALNGLFGNLDIQGSGANIIHINTISASTGQPAQRQNINVAQRDPSSIEQRNGDPTRNQGVRMVAANQAINEIVSVGPSGIEINLRNTEPARAGGNTSSNFVLPHVPNLTSEIYRNQDLGAWPTMPRSGLRENSLTVFGNYLHSINLQINLLLPAMQRFSEVAQRETTLTDQGERQRLMTLGNQIGRAIERLIFCLRPAGQILRNIRVQDGAGNFGIEPVQNEDAENQNHSSQPPRQPQQTQPPRQPQQAQPQRQPQQAPVPPQQSQTANNNQNPLQGLAGLFGGMGLPQGGSEPLQMDLSALLGNVQQMFGEQAGADGQGPDLSGLFGSLQGMFPGMNLPPQAQAQPQAQASPERPPAETSAQPSPRIDINSSGQNGGAGVQVTVGRSSNIMEARIRDLQINVNNQSTTAPKDFGDVIIGALRSQDLLKMFTGDVTPLDSNHAEIRSDTNAYIEEHGGLEQAKTKFVQTANDMFLEGLKNNPHVYEGFEPEEVSKEISHKHYYGIIECIRRDDYTEVHPFSKVAPFLLIGTHHQTQELHRGTRLRNQRRT